MKRMVLMLVVSFGVGIVVGIVGTQNLTAQQPPVKTTQALKADIVGMEGKEVIVYFGEFAPAAASGRHYHPGDEVLVVVEGSTTRETEGHPPLDLKAGEAAYIPAMQVVNTKNTSTTSPLKVVVFRIHPKGQPIVHRVTDPYFWK